jgi:hypothetical protein
MLVFKIVYLLYTFSTLIGSLASDTAVHHTATVTFAVDYEILVTDAGRTGIFG